MNIVNLNADIVPGEGAAGFVLGVHLTQVRSIFERVTRWDSRHETLREAVARCDGWLQASAATMSDGVRQGQSFFYRHGTVELHFNEEGVLTAIAVFHGYVGTLFGKIRIGDQLAGVTDFCELIFDEDEDMHFPIDGAIAGLAFGAEFEPLSKAPSQRIFGIFIVNRQDANARRACE